MKISNGVAMLQLQIQGFRLNPTLIWDDESAILIDTGNARSVGTNTKSYE